MIKIVLECGGCDAKAEFPLFKRFISITGRSWGLGHCEWESIEDNAPDGWTVADPYTQCCYCDSCMAEIGEEVANG